MRVCGEMCRYIYRVYMYVSEVEIVFIVSCCAGGPGSTWNQRRRTDGCSFSLIALGIFHRNFYV